MKRTPIIVAGILVLLSITFGAGRWTGRSGQQASSPGRRVLYYVDPMHPAYRSDKPGIAPDCGMALVPVFEGEGSVSQTALQAGAVELSPERQRLIGVRVAIASRSDGMRTIRTTGRVVPDENHLYRIQAGTDGWVESLHNNPPGTRVTKGQVLATLYSPDIRTAQVNYLGFVAGVQRLKANASTMDMKSIEDSGRINEEQLRLYGMGDKQLNDLNTTYHATSSLDLVAPGDGVVLARGISPQQRFEKGSELYRIADLRKVWIVADVHGDDGALLPGTQVSVSVPEVGKKIKATVSAATPLFDETSRTLKLRLEANNPGLALRPDMLVNVEFESRAPAGLSIPADAVLDSGLRKVVYVETTDGIFEPRPVQIDATYGDRVTIANGINEGDRIVVAGNFLLDSESRMRSAGQQTADTKPKINAANEPVGVDATHSTIKQVKLAVEAQDTVCGMTLKAGDTAFQESYKGKTFSFCSESCRKDFLADPARYADHRTQGPSKGQDQADPHHD